MAGLTTTWSFDEIYDWMSLLTLENIVDEVTDSLTAGTLSCLLLTATVIVFLVGRSSVLLTAVTVTVWGAFDGVCFCNAVIAADVA